MFTSEHWRRLRDTSSPHRASAAILGRAFLLALLICTSVLKVWTGDLSHRVQTSNALGLETRVVITGSSHLFATLNPTWLRIPSTTWRHPFVVTCAWRASPAGNLAKVPHL